MLAAKFPVAYAGGRGAAVRGISRITEGDPLRARTSASAMIAYEYEPLVALALVEEERELEKPIAISTIPGRSRRRGAAGRRIERTALDTESPHRAAL